MEKPSAGGRERGHVLINSLHEELSSPEVEGTVNMKLVV